MASTLPKLRFPRDKPSDYKGVIEFRLVQIEAPTVNLVAAQNFINILSEDGVGTNQQATTNSNQQEFDTILPGRREDPSPYPNVTLYLPQAITFNDGMEYDNTVQLGLIGASAEAAINAGGSVGAAIAQAAATAQSSFTDLFSSLPTQDLARLAIARGASNLGQTATDVASSALRTTLNPNRRTLFRGVRPREFSFAFKMIANSAVEAQEIDDIVSFFRREMYPQSIVAKGISAGYKYPNPFLIDLKYGPNRVGTRILNSYLSSIQIVYNQSSMGFHVDGKPSEVDVSLFFLEERTLARDDIEKGY
jgi:hypothetical protein